MHTRRHGPLRCDDCRLNVRSTVHPFFPAKKECIWSLEMHACTLNYAFVIHQNNPFFKLTQATAVRWYQERKKPGAEATEKHTKRTFPVRAALQVIAERASALLKTLHAHRRWPGSATTCLSDARRLAAHAFKYSQVLHEVGERAVRRASWCATASRGERRPEIARQQDRRLTGQELNGRYYRERRMDENAPLLEWQLIVAATLP